MAMGEELGAQRLHQRRDGTLPTPAEVGRPYCRAASGEERYWREIPDEVGMSQQIFSGDPGKGPGED